ncbi:MAG: diguanylate cyclase [Phycisphaerae bacterium]|nr:diguanylate cyclase [Phycisphaerae bacterium]
MNTRTGLSIPARIALAAFLAASTCGLVSLVLYQVDRDAGRTREYLGRIRVWAQIGAHQVAEANGTSVIGGQDEQSASADATRMAEQFRRWSWAMLQNPEVVAALLVDRGGRIVAQAPQGVGVGGLDELGDPDASTARQTLRVAGVDRDVHVIAAPVRKGPEDAAIGHVVVLALADGIPMAAGGIIRFLLVTGAAAVMTALAVLGWARRSLGRPLSALIRHSADPDEDGAKGLPTSRSDELGELARAVQELADRLRHAESRADALESTLQTRVATRTRRIEAMLNQARKETWVESLTQLYNRRFLDDQLENLIREQLAAGEDLAVIALDIDYFKQVNDTLGHAAGDELLVFVGELLRATLRSTDIGVRLGGDEFVVLLFGASLTDAAGLAERLVRLFGQRAGLLNVGAPVSMSGGVASLRASRVQTGHELLQVADAALYRAKRGGKDAVEIASANP